MNDNHYQVGVIPITKEGHIVLVTTRSGDYWIFPKGNREKGRSDRAVARLEAFEEAGVKGVMKRKSHDFKTPLGKVKRLRLYPMQVKVILKKFPEQKMRKRVIVPFEKAEKLVQTDLQLILQKIRKWV